MARRSILYEISLAGAENARQQLLEFNKTLREGGTVDYAQYRDAQRQVIQTTRGMNNEQRLNQQIFLSMHPRILETTRALGLFSHVTGTAMNAMNVMNTAQILLNTNTVKELELRNDVTRAQREYNLAIEQNQSPEQLANLSEKLMEAKEAQKQFNEESSQQKMMAYFTFATSIAHLGTDIAALVAKTPEFISLLKKLTGAFGGGGGTSIIPSGTPGGGISSGGGPRLSPPSAPAPAIPISTGSGCLEICNRSQAGMGQEAGKAATEGLKSALRNPLTVALITGAVTGTGVLLATKMDEIKGAIDDSTKKITDAFKPSVVGQISEGSSINSAGRGSNFVTISDPTDSGAVKVKEIFPLHIPTMIPNGPISNTIDSFNSDSHDVTDSHDSTDSHAQTDSNNTTNNTTNTTTQVTPELIGTLMVKMEQTQFQTLVDTISGKNAPKAESTTPMPSSQGFAGFKNMEKLSSEQEEALTPNQKTGIGSDEWLQQNRPDIWKKIEAERESAGQVQVNNMGRRMAQTGESPWMQHATEVPEASSTQTQAGNNFWGNMLGGGVTGVISLLMKQLLFGNSATEAVMPKPPTSPSGSVMAPEGGGHPATIAAQRAAGELRVPVQENPQVVRNTLRGGYEPPEYKTPVTPSEYNTNIPGNAARGAEAAENVVAKTSPDAVEAAKGVGVIGKVAGAISSVEATIAGAIGIWGMTMAGLFDAKTSPFKGLGQIGEAQASSGDTPKLADRFKGVSADIDKTKDESRITKNYFDDIATNVDNSKAISIGVSSDWDSIAKNTVDAKAASTTTSSNMTDAGKALVAAIFDIITKLSGISVKSNTNIDTSPSPRTSSGSTSRMVSSGNSSLGLIGIGGIATYNSKGQNTSLSAFYHAAGGLIDEPMVGRTKSGETHVIGEAGPEIILPLSKISGATTGNTTVASVLDKLNAGDDYSGSAGGMVNANPSSQNMGGSGVTIINETCYYTIGGTVVAENELLKLVGKNSYQEARQRRIGS